jgi:hypothetical protein
MKPYQLNGVNVHEGMYMRAKTAQGNGQKVFLTEFPYIVEAPKAAVNAHCLNCDGAGKIGLEIIIFKTPPTKSMSSGMKGCTMRTSLWFLSVLIALAAGYLAGRRHGQIRCHYNVLAY